MSTVLVAHKRRRTHREAHHERHEDPNDVLDDTVGGHAVSADEGHELVVVQHRDERHGQVRYQLGSTVGARLAQGAQVNHRLAQAQVARVLAREVEKRQAATDDLADCRGDGRAGKAPTEDDDEQGVKHDICHTGADDDGKTDLRFAGRGQKALKRLLQHERGHGNRADGAIEDSQIEQRTGRLEQLTHRAHEDDAENRRHDTHGKNGVDDEREQAVCPLFLAFAQRLGHERRTAGAEHHAQRANHHDERIDEVEGRKRLLAHEVGDKEAINHAIDAGKHHHDGRRGRKTQELSQREVL